MSVRVAMFPESWRNNPVLDLMEYAVKARGVEIVPVGGNWLSFGWLWRKRKAVDVLHLHWLEYHYRSPSLAASWVALAKFSGKLLFARCLGYRIVWSMHNALPHERGDVRLDVVALRWVLAMATAVIVHCEEARRLLSEHYGRRRRVFTAPLGHYIAAYPQRIVRADARNQLGIAQDARCLLFFGAVRPYKGIERLLEEFKAVSDARLRLIIAGKPLDESYAARIRELASQDARVNAVLEWIPDDQVPFYFGAADVVVLPFTNILTSSSVITAMSFGKPVIVPTVGCLPEVVGPECGLLYDPAEPGALRSALQACSQLDLEAMGRAALERIRRFTWDGFAVQAIAAYTA